MKGIFQGANQSINRVNSVYERPFCYFNIVMIMNAVRSTAPIEIMQSVPRTYRIV